MDSTSHRSSSLRRVAAVAILAGALGIGTPPAATQLCVFSQGYWKTHASEWRVTSLVLGNPANAAHTYTKSELLAILDTNVKNDASMTLAYQLIAAKLNLAAGSEAWPIATALARADQLLTPFTGKLPYKVQQNSPTGKEMVSVAKVLEDYNLGRIAGSCPVPNQPPAARAGGPYTGVVGQPVAFDGRGSSDPDGDSLTFAWTFGDGESATGAAPSHAYALTGQFTVVLTVTDGRGGSNASTTTATISPAPPPNRNPIAVANGPYTANAGEPVQFSSAGSSDPDGDPLTFSWAFGDGATSTDPNPQHAYAAAGPFTASLTVSDGRGGTNTATAGVSVTTAPPANRIPIAQANGPYTGSPGEPIAFSSAGSFDPDGDPLTFLWDFGDGSKASEPNPQHTYQTAGPFTATVTVDDGRGGTNTATASVNVTTAVTLQSLSIDPPSLRFSQFNVATALVVTGHYSDGSERNLTDPQTGTTYSSNAPSVVSAAANGVVTALANGDATVTVTNGAVTRGVSVVVEEGVTLQALELTPPIVTLRALGLTAQVTLRGSFSNGAQRDLTSDPATVFSLDQPSIASVGATGLLTALAPGDAVLTARSGGLSSTAQVRVLVTAGTGFLRGETFDDSRGLPLGGTSATLLVSGGAPIAASATITADDRGRFAVPAAEGDALVRIERSGFTSVDRLATLTSNGIVTLLDARLTPLDGKVNLLQSVFGGEASSTDGTAAVSVPPGSLSADVALRVTPLSNQGLQNVLPIGWSPIAAVDLQPTARTFAQPATLRLPHADTLAAGASVALAMYDVAAHLWVVVAPGQVSGDRRTIAATIGVTGQYAFIVPDDSPASPSAAVPGEALAGVAGGVTIPDTSKATGEVTPRSAPPGDARAMGTIVLQPPAPLSSGAVLRARVSEQFDLLDQSQVQPQPFVQDVVLYNRPRIGAAGTLAARLPITPSLQFTIQQLSLGTVRLDVTIDESVFNQSIVGTTGGSLTDAAGNVLEIPAGALPADIALGLLPLSAAQFSTPVPAGFTLLGAAQIDLIGGSFAQPAILSIARPASLDPAAQVIVAQVIGDGAGGRRLKIVGLGAITASRVQIQLTLGALTFPGVRGGGEYLFLQPAQPLGFITGLVNANGNAQALALVTTDTAPFAVVTDGTGGYLVAGRAGVATAVSAVEPAGANATGSTTLAALNAIATLNLSVAVTAPAVIATVPSANAVNVALDAPILVDFSKAIDPATITGTAVVLRAGQNVVSAQASLSANRKRLTVTPVSPLAGLTLHTLTLTSEIRDGSGAALVPFAPLVFTTLDPSKATALALGSITAELPDEDNLSLVTGAPGAAEPNSAVVATNLRTQETVTVLSLADGSFRLRVSVIVGDEIALTLRDPNGRETTISITQFSSFDGTTSIGSGGGTIQGAEGRLGRILPRALATAGVFHLTDAGGATLPTLPASFALVDRFALAMGGATFRRLDSLTLSESQGRFAPATTFGAPLAAAGQLTVPPDFLVSASLRFSTAVSDRDGTRHSASGATVVVASAPDGSAVETGFGDQFPTVFLTAPKQAVPTQVVDVSAIAPAARIDFDLPTTFAPQAGDGLVLARATVVGGEPKLAVVDRLTRVDTSGTTRLRTTGRDLPGASLPGEYVVIAGPLSHVTGRASGPAAIVSVDGLPFVFETDGANGAFALPVAAGAPFTLRFTDAVTGASLGTTSGVAAPPAGSIDLGQPLSPAAGALRVSVQPDASSVVDISALLVFTFSEPIDRSSLTTGAFVITDPAGVRVFGTSLLSDDGRTVTFAPNRRWKYATTYRYGVNTSVAAASGARMLQPLFGEFTTFSPSVASAAALGDATAVSVDGPLAIVGTDDAVHIVDVVSPLSPQPQLRFDVPGGAHVTTIVPPQILVNRHGEAIAATTAVIAGGDASTGVELQVFETTTPGAAVRIGQVRVTAAAGQTPAPGVLPAAGAAADLALSEDGTAFVAIVDAGLVAVHLGQAIPLDPSAVASVAGRYPAAGVESVTGVALLGDRIAVAGIAGLTILDRQTLSRTGGAFVSGGLRDVRTVSSVAIDLNGDSSIAPDSETFDLAIATGAADDTVQLYRVPAVGDPALISVVHVGAAPSSLAIEVAERIAYVTTGARGIAAVDLDAPFSIQPIDSDRDGVDDRILGNVDSPGRASRLALQAEGGTGLLADGAAGLVVLRLLPARTRFLSLRRDPVAALAFDDEPILQTRAAYVTDDGLTVSLATRLPAGEQANLVIQEVPSGGPALLSFEDGGIVAPLSGGLAEKRLRVAHNDVTVATDFRLSVQVGGGTLATLEGRLTRPDLDAVGISALIAVPSPGVITPASSSLQLAVAGRRESGKYLNLTRATNGTTYLIRNTTIASVDADGLVTPRAGGSASVEIHNRASATAVQIAVQRPVAVVRLDGDPAFVTLRSVGQQQLLAIIAELTDGSTQPAAAILGTTFQSNNPSVVAVDASGQLTAVAAGSAIVTVTNGSALVDVAVHVELREPANVDAISLLPIPELSVDDGRLLLTAQLSGTGSLDGLLVTFAVPGLTAAPLNGETSLLGRASVQISPLVAGTFQTTATIVDPATGDLRSVSASLAIAAGSRDSEPNDLVAAASPLRAQRQVDGSIGGGDAADTFRLETTLAGTLRIQLRLGSGAIPSDVVLVVRGHNGAELSRIPISSLSSVITLPDGAAYVGLESTGAATSYSLTFELEQASVSVLSIVPASGAAGTPVVLNGTGFSPVRDDNIVFFGSVPADVISATPTRLDVRVPANAVNGPVEVVVRNQRWKGSNFITGRTQLPEPFTLEEDPNAIRQSPTSKQLFDITRFIVTADASVDTAAMAAAAKRLGALVAGMMPTQNRYVLEFPGVNSLSGYVSRRQLLVNAPEIRQVAASGYKRVRLPELLDVRDAETSDVVARTAAYRRVKLIEAIEAIRRTPPFEQRSAFTDASIAIIDDGFRPILRDEFAESVRVMQVVTTATSNGLVHHFEPVTETQQDEHGSAVASVIAAVNNGNELSGVLNGVVDLGETPFQVDLYGVALRTRAQLLADGKVLAALDHIKQLAPVDVINMSFGATFAAVGDELSEDLDKYRGPFRALGADTLMVVAAGNESSDAALSSPAALSLTESNVLTVGASDDDDAMATFSNFGAPLQIAAPGKGVLVTAPGSGLDRWDGTSFSAPMVAGAAALLGTLDGTLTPLRVKQILVETADDITAAWGSPMRRLNIDAAVRRVLPVVENQKLFVADAASDVDASAPGALVGLEINPLNGQLAPSAGSTVVVPLQRSIAGGAVTEKFEHPTTLAMSPDGNRLYVAVSKPGGIVDGVAFVSTQSFKLETFVPLGELLSPLRFDTVRPPMAVSLDGLLLYVGADHGILLINTVNAKVVRDWTDLPLPYRAHASTAPVPYNDRLSAIRGLASSPPGFGSATISALTLSPDGRTLYAALRPSAGTLNGRQPGAAIAIDVDFYRDALPGTKQVDTDFSTVLSIPFDPPTIPRPQNAIRTTGDEPSAVAVAKDGGTLYLLNGGMTSFDTAPATPEQLTAIQADPSYGLLVEFGLPIVGTPVVTSLQAPGFTWALQVPTVLAPSSGRFNSSVASSWQAKAGGVVIDQFSFPHVYAARPYAIAMKPDGRRALVSYFQTGNFGVLDLDHQQRFPNAPSDEAFAGVVAVTPALPLDTNVWPRRGAFTAFGTPVASPDESLLFPVGLVYAQNGRFAAAVHSGVGVPHPVPVTIPSIERSNVLRLALNALGYAIAPGASGGSNADGDTVASGQSKTFTRGGGALSIIDDTAIGADLLLHDQLPVPVEGGSRPYYSARPLCAQATADAPKCDVPPTRVSVEYDAPGVGKKRFFRPSGVAIQPFVAIQSPRFGEVFGDTQEIIFTWRDSRASQLDLLVYDPAAGPNPIATFPDALSPIEKDQKFAKRLLILPFANSNLTAVDRKVYTIEVVLKTASDELSRTSVTVTYRR